MTTLQMQSDAPTLFLEDLDHLLNEVTCDGPTMRLAFRSVEQYKIANTELRKLVSGWVVSSHQTCSEEGAHAAYRYLPRTLVHLIILFRPADTSSVSNVKFDDASLIMILSTYETTLRTAFKNITFDFFETSESYSAHAHDRLIRRQSDPTTQSTSTSTRPTPTDWEPPPDSTQTADLGFSSLDTNFEIWDVSLPFNLGCRNCTGTGQLALKTTSIAFNDLFDNDDDDLFKSGKVEIDLTGFSLSIGLKAIPEDDYSDEITIFQKTVVGVEVSMISRRKSATNIFCRSLLLDTLAWCSV
jgi:hypothetical protein